MDSYNLTLLYIVYHYSSHLLIMSLLLCDTLYIHLFFCGLVQNLCYSLNRWSSITSQW